MPVTTDKPLVLKNLVSSLQVVFVYRAVCQLYQELNTTNNNLPVYIRHHCHASSEGKW